MLKHNKFLLYLGLAILIIFSAAYGFKYFLNSKGDNEMVDGEQGSGPRLTSTEFEEGKPIPTRFTCKGQDINPPLHITDKPADSKSMALIMHDPDAVSGDFVHWLVWDIPPSTDSIAPNTVPVGAIQGVNSAKSNKYVGPCPPTGTGTHRYMFELYFLDQALQLKPSSTRVELEEAMEGHVIAHTNLIGLVQAEGS